MFTGIIEALGTVKEVVTKGTNRSFIISSTLSSSFKIDQSVSHNGACLTIEETGPDWHRATAIDETLKKTSLGEWKTRSLVNLEQCLQLNGRLDGHFVQGHVDSTGTCLSRIEKDGSWEFEIKFPEKFAGLMIEKGSICMNGISLTSFHVQLDRFTVAIIPYTFDNTNIKDLHPGANVNLEFDMLGKYINRQIQLNETLFKTE